MKNIAVSVSHVKKTFQLPGEKETNLKQAIIHFHSNREVHSQQVLHDVSFTINKGEFFGIVGRNGSGKSTLLKLLAGVYFPNSGNIKINGTLTPFIELGVGFNPELTGRENVYLNGALLGFDRQQMSEMYSEIVDFAELEDFMDQKLKNYSSGMQVRLAFSVSIKVRSDILLIDEVLAVGDAAFQRKCYDYFMHLKKIKQTVVLVTHDMGAVRQYCDRAIMIEKGEIIKEGTPKEVARSYQALFSDEIAQDVSGRPTDQDRWGNAKIQAVGIEAVVSEQYITLTTSFKAFVSTDAPIYGFTIFNSQGQNVMESNTKKLWKPTKHMNVDEKTTFSWVIPNIFSTGTYNVSVACCDQSAVEFYDWLNGAASFSISKDEVTAGIVDPPVSLKDSNN